MKPWKQNLLFKILDKWARSADLNGKRPTSEPAPYAFTTDAYENVQHLLAETGHAVDIIVEPLGTERDAPLIVYLKGMVNLDMQHREVIRPVKALHLQGGKWERLYDVVAVGVRQQAKTLGEATKLLFDGWTLVAVPGRVGFFGFLTEHDPVRSVEKAENQTIVIGPQDAFNESIDQNIALVRKRLRTPTLMVEMQKIGRITRTKVAILGLRDVLNEDNLQELRRRLATVDFDGVLDSGMLVQLLDDQPLSPFPQFNLTERPDVVAGALLEGKVVLIVDGTPYAVTAPTGFIEFFHSPEDQFNRWMSSSLVRLLRLVGVLVSVTLSAFYVSILTFHYEVIPANMLKTIAQSRARVPFPPLYEALFLELTLEVLREAGARLPTKVGQTMGIVGGIVIGQAAVQAGLTSNVMIIVVSLSALASFVTPSYVMGNAVRVIRFPMILVSGAWGFIGLSVGLLTLLLHLLNLSTLGTPYMAPIAPLRLSDLKDTLIRVPTQFFIFRPTVLKTRRNKQASVHSWKRK